MLLNIIFEEGIQLNIDAKDREDAIRKAALPLLKAEKIKEEYINNIIRSLEENGPYFVLAPGIALPHARPEEGANETSLGITVLNQPVEFQSEANDPVKYIFTLSAVNDTDHLGALASLSDLLEDEKFIQLLDECEHPQKVIDYIKEEERRK